MAYDGITKGRDFYSAREEGIRQMKETAERSRGLPPGYNGAFRREEQRKTRQNTGEQKHDTYCKPSPLKLPALSFLSSVKDDDFLLIAILFLLLNEDNSDDYLILLILIIVLFT